MSRKLFRKKKRDWLNPLNGSFGDSGAATTAVNVKTMNQGAKTILTVEAELSIRDCSRRVTLDFDVYADNEKFARQQISERLKKIKILRSHLDLIETGLFELAEAMGDAE